MAKKEEKKEGKILTYATGFLFRQMRRQCGAGGRGKEKGTGARIIKQNEEMVAVMWGVYIYGVSLHSRKRER